MLLPIDFKEGNLSVSVDFLSRRMLHRALLQMSLQLLFPFEKRQRILAKVQLLGPVILRRKRREIPRVHLVISKLDAQNIPDFCELLVLLQRPRIKLRVLRVGMRVPVPALVAFHLILRRDAVVFYFHIVLLVVLSLLFLLFRILLPVLFARLRVRDFLRPRFLQRP